MDRYREPTKKVWKKPTDIWVMERLKDKGITYRVPILRPKEWRRLISADPTIPRSYGQMKILAGRLFDPTLRERLRQRDFAYRPIEGLHIPAVEECGESAYASFFAGLSNPHLAQRQRLSLESDMDEDTAGFEHQHETDHFVLNWTDSSSNAADNISDASIITETGDHLEHAWDVYETVFGRTPYLPSGASKMEVVFEDIGGYGVASPPDGPIKFDAPNWISKPGIRRPTSAHELFHKLQYAYGYRTTWTPSGSYKWFSEGSASWAEVFVWQRVSAAYKLLDLFADPDMNLWDASYRALPFWVFFESRQRSDPMDNPLVNFLGKYEAGGDEKTAVAESIEDEWAPNNVYRSLGSFFALFARDRSIGHWKIGPTGAVYGDILDPDDTAVAPALAYVDVALGSGDSYANTATVPQIGSDYYAFKLGTDSGGETLSITVDGVAVGDFSHYQIWRKNGAFTKAVFPFFATGDYSFSTTIDLDDADELELVVSGRGVGGGYSIAASIT